MSIFMVEFAFISLEMEEKQREPNKEKHGKYAWMSQNRCDLRAEKKVGI